MKKIITRQFFLVITSILFVGGIASAQSTGFMNPSDTALPHGWTNPLNGMVSDGQWTTVTHGAGCNCPWLYLSWDGGLTYTSSMLIGPYDTNDSWRLAGGPANLWGRTAWVDSEFSNKNFRLKITNPGLSISQGYRDFNFSIPAGSTINGIEVNTQAHGDTGYHHMLVNALEVNVYYTTLSGIGTAIATYKNIELFPNPAHTRITMHLTGLSELKYSLYSIDGRLIINKDAGTIPTDYSASINVEGIPNGIYIFKIESNLGTEYRKIVIQ